MLPPDVSVDVPIRVRVLGRPTGQTVDDLEDRVTDVVSRRRREVDLRIDGLSELPSRDRAGIRRAFEGGIDAGLGGGGLGGKTGPPAPTRRGDGEAPPADTEPVALDLAAVARLIRQRFPNPSADLRHGVYVTLSGDTAPRLYFLDGAEVRSVPISARGTKTPIRYPEGTYTLSARPGSSARIYRGNERLADLDNPTDLDLDINFAVPAAVDAAATPVRWPHRYWPRLRVLRASKETNLTVGAHVRYAADVEIWRVDGDDWAKVPLALIYAFIRYRWTVYRLARDIGGRKVVVAHEAAGNALFVHEWAQAGEYEVECEVRLDYADASPQPETDRRFDTVTELEVRAALDLALLELQDVQSGQSAWQRSAEAMLATLRGRLRVAEWTDSSNPALADSLRTTLGKLEKHLVGQTGAGPFPIRAIFTERRTGHSRPITLFAGPAATPKPGQAHTWLLIDLTYPGSYNTFTGSGPSPAGALRAAFEDGRTSIFNSYPPGRILARVEWPGMDRFGMTPFDFAIETESNQRTAHEWLAAAATWLPVAGLGLTLLGAPHVVAVGTLVLGGLAGTALGIAEFIEHHHTNSLDWDRQTAVDLLNLLGAITVVAGPGVRLIGEGVPFAIGPLTRLATLVPYRQAVLYAGLAGDVGSLLLVAHDTVKELRDAETQLSGKILADYRAIYGEEEGWRRFAMERITRMLGILARAAAKSMLTIISMRATTKQLAAKPPRLPAPPPPSLPPPSAAQLAEANRLRERIVTDLTEVAKTANNRQARHDLAQLLRQLQDNSKAGSNAKIIPVVRKVFRALRDPQQIADVMADIWLEAQRIGGPGKYERAVINLSRRTGANFSVLGTELSFTTEEFYREVVTQKYRFLDLSAKTGFSKHGATTHLIQDLVADRALRGTGMRAEEFRALFAEAVGEDGQNIGNRLWVTIFDSFEDGLNQPETLYPALSKAFGGELP